MLLVLIQGWRLLVDRESWQGFARWHRIEPVAFGNRGGNYKIMPSDRMDFVQNRSNGRTIRRAGADMMKANNSVRIDENISAPLANVPFRLP